MLVLFLDKAKLTRMLPSDPCLFLTTAKCKSSRDILLLLARNLSGEGDFLRHLMFLGYAVTHRQQLLDEVEFTVRNLATDLRDGIRLARLISIHQRDPALLSVRNE
jgi:abnormal spindle-like microcephaly-associated protein